MPRLPIPLLVGALLSALLPCTGLAQPQASGLPDGEVKALVESLYGVPSDPSDYPEFRLYPRRLEVGRHDD